MRCNDDWHFQTSVLLIVFFIDWWLIDWLQVNGVDVSGSQERALEELSTAQEPIMVQIRRKEADSGAIDSCANNSCDNNNSTINNDNNEVEDDAYYDDDQIIIPDLEYQVRGKPALSCMLNGTLTFIIWYGWNYIQYI